MKKVLLIIFAGMLSFSQANAGVLGDASLTLGVGYNEAVFAATGQERNHDESGTLRTTVEEYGAFNEEFASLFIEAGTDKVSVGVSIASKFNTPEHISGDERTLSNAANRVSAEFENFMNIYGLRLFFLYTLIQILQKSPRLFFLTSMAYPISIRI